MKIQLARISILQSSKIVTAINAIIGLLYTAFGIPMVVLGSGQVRIIGIIYLFGPVFTAVCGFIGFCLIASLYNALNPYWGGIEAEIKIQAPAVNFPKAD